LPSLVTLEALAALRHATIAELLTEAPPQRSEEGERLLAMPEPLPPAERRVVLKMLETFVDFLCERPVASPYATPRPWS
jgi:hypothetical protein